MASTVPARKAIKARQLPQAIINASSYDDERGHRESHQETWLSVAMTAINFVAFLLSLVAVDIHYNFRRSTMGTTAMSVMPRWLHGILRPSEPYASYYRTKQRKLFKMEAEDAFRLRNVTLVFLGLTCLSSVLGLWYLIGWASRSWARVKDG